MVHSENPRALELVRQNWEMWVQAMRMARNLLKAEEPIDFHEKENVERYYAFVPLIANKMVDDMFSNSAFLKQAPESMQEERISGVSMFIKEMTQFNDKIEKDQKK